MSNGSTYRCCQHCPESIHGLHIVPCMICAADAQRDGTSAAAEVHNLRAEVERLTDEVDALKTACQRIQADLDGSLGLVIDRAEIQPHLDALDDAGRPGWWLS